MSKRIVILGAGESGVGTAILACQKGFDVFVSDSGSIQDKYKEELSSLNIAYEEIGHTESNILNADIIVKSPGIPDKIAIIQKCIKKEIPIVSEIEFAFPYTSAKIIAVTGSNGKTTTTSLIYHIMKSCGLNVSVGGNIGLSFARQVATSNPDYFVLELSSFQLDGCFLFKPYIAILTNITEDHLDRYDYIFEKYILSKFRITQNQDENDFFIYDMDDEITDKYLKNINIKAKKIPYSHKKILNEGAYIEDEQIVVKINKNIYTMPTHDLTINGMHNRYNSMAASIAANLLDLRKQNIREAFQNFVNEEHRLEYVAKVGGIDFINDSKATNVNSVWYALEAQKKKIIWIAGGQDKGNDYEPLKELVKNRVKAIICLGKDNRKIHENFHTLVDVVINTDNIKDCVEMAYKVARSGEVVLLSPACASFDLFKNYEDRGKQFRKQVREL